MGEYIRNSEIEIKHVPKWIMLLFGGYIFLSYFETYLTRFIGSNTKFYLFGLIAIFIYICNFRIKLNIYNLGILFWFSFKFISTTWSKWINSDISIHVMSQIGMTLFVLIMIGAIYEEKFLNYILRINYWCSFLFGILSIIFQGSYISEEYEARKVLTLFGLQNDPNNCAAFLIIGITLAAYSLVYEREKKICNIIVVLINTYATLLTSSRAGFVSLAIILIAMIFLSKKDDKIMDIIKKIFIILIVVIVLGYIVSRYLPESSLDRLLKFEEYKAGSGRSDRWEAAIKLFIQRPMFGWGWGGYLTGYGAIHNTILTSLCDVGIIGTTLLFIPVIAGLYKAMKKKNVLAILLLVCGLAPSVFIDAINKRFFWNSLVISFMLIVYQNKTGKQIKLWSNLKGDTYE